METEGQREARLRRMRQNRARQLASETEEQRKARLEGLRQYQTRRLASEKEEQRKAKLEGLRQYQTRRLTRWLLNLLQDLLLTIQMIVARVQGHFNESDLQKALVEKPKLSPKWITTSKI